ncbi:MAG: hypothetical protein ACOYOO_08670 [Saprospiraceae bacterium]
MKSAILQSLGSDTLQMLLGFVLFLIVARQVMKWVKQGKETPVASTPEKMELPPLPPMDVPEPAMYASSRGLGDIVAAAPALPEIPLSPEQRQQAAEWLKKNLL